MAKVNRAFFHNFETFLPWKLHNFWKLVHVFFVHNIFVAIGASEHGDIISPCSE